MSEHQNVDWFAEDRDLKEEALMHYGVKGMKWGVRNERPSIRKAYAYRRYGGRSAKNANTTARYHKNAVGRRDKVLDVVKKGNTALYGKSKLGKKVSGAMNKYIDATKKVDVGRHAHNASAAYSRKVRDVQLNTTLRRVDTARKFINSKLAMMPPGSKRRERAEKRIDEIADLYEALKRDLND